MGNNTSKKIAKYFFIYFSVVAFGMVTYAVKIDLTRSKEKVLLHCFFKHTGIPPNQ